MTNIFFLQKLSNYNQEKNNENQSNDRQRPISSNFLNQFCKEIYGEQAGEFVWGYWGFKGEIKEYNYFSYPYKNRKIYHTLFMG